MKIKSLEVDNHPILGTFSYDFEEGKSTTLLVGKNGSGKTRFIELLHILLDKSFRVWEVPDWNQGSISRIKLSVELEGDETKNLASIQIEGTPTLQGLSSGHIYFEATKKTESYNDFDIYMLNADGETYSVIHNAFKESLESEKAFAKVLRDKTRYSGVQINFEYKPVTSYSDIVDDDKKIQTKSTVSLADEINKLLVATFNRDNTYLGKESRKGNAHPDYKGDFDRFKDAYYELFKTKQIVDVQQDGADNKIIFKDVTSDREFGIDGLSSGEQQIVYRAGYLLRHLNIKNGGVVFIDEPELSLHPEWQIGYLQFLQKIFGENIQFIIATHSPYIVQSGCHMEDVSISRLFGDSGDLKNEEMNKTSKLGQASYAEVGYKVFGVAGEEYHRELYLALTAKLQVGEKPTEIDKHLFLNAEIPTITTLFGKETVMSFIRNIYHHGANAVAKRGRTYTPHELEDSIKVMEGLL